MTIQTSNLLQLSTKITYSIQVVILGVANDDLHFQVFVFIPFHYEKIIQSETSYFVGRTLEAVFAQLDEWAANAVRTLDSKQLPGTVSQGAVEYTAVCGECGDEHHIDFIPIPSQDEVFEMFSGDGWQMRSGWWYCPDCVAP